MKLTLPAIALFLALPSAWAGSSLAASRLSTGLPAKTISDGSSPLFQRKEPRQLSLQDGTVGTTDGKISGSLSRFVTKLGDQGIRTTATIGDIKLSRYSSTFIRIKNDGKVHVTLYVTAADEGVIKTLTEKNFEVERVLSDFGRIQGWIPFDKLADLEALDFVKRIAPPSYGIVREGSVTTEGDSVLGAEGARKTYGLTGSGIKVGVVSNGVSGIFDSVASGDLPTGDDSSCSPGGTQTSSVHCKSFSANGIAEGAEGTAMLEIVHDLAPKAELTFVSVFTSDDMIDAINYLGGVVDIIVDDLGFPENPFFEDGDLASAAQTLTEKGILYVSSAGNDALTHIQQTFADSDSDGVNEFPNGYETLGVSIAGGETFTAVLQWDDDFDHPTNDLNLYIDLYTYPGYSSAGEESGTENNLDGITPAVEGLTVVNTTGNYLIGFLYIEKKEGDGSDVVLELFTRGAATQEYYDPKDSIFGHSAVPGVIAVAAVDSADSGNDTIESFSSQGPVTISGNERNKPDITAVDGVDVTGNGSFSTPFYGTSASAAHIAGCLALIREADKTLTVLKATELLISNAVDIGSAGYDLVSGYGRADCLKAIPSMATVTDSGSTGETDNDNNDDSIEDSGTEETGESTSKENTSDNASSSGGGCSLSRVRN